MVNSFQIYKTQWTAQFYVAAELTKRGYLVSFTLGNAPGIDLHVSDIEGNKHFEVDIKGHWDRNFWDIREPRRRSNHYYILVDKLYSTPRYYILSNQEMTNEWNEYYRKTEIKRRKKGKGISKKERWGILISQADKYEDKWKTLNQ